MTHSAPSAGADRAEQEAARAALNLGKAARLLPYRDIDTIIADFAMYQADHLIKDHGFNETDRLSIERGLRLHAQQGLAKPTPDPQRATQAA